MEHRGLQRCLLRQSLRVVDNMVPGSSERKSIEKKKNLATQPPKTLKMLVWQGCGQLGKQQEQQPP